MYAGNLPITQVRRPVLQAVFYTVVCMCSGAVSFVAPDKTVCGRIGILLADFQLEISVFCFIRQNSLVWAEIGFFVFLTKNSAAVLFIIL